MTAQEVERLIVPMIGQPYRPDFRCWDLVRYVSRVVFNRPLPEVPDEVQGRFQIARAFRTSPERARWKISAVPKAGAIVLVGAAMRETHAGIYLNIDGGGVLHTEERTGIVLEPFSELEARVHTLNCYEPVA